METGAVSDSFTGFWDPTPHPALIHGKVHSLTATCFVDIHGRPVLSRTKTEGKWIGGWGQRGRRDWEERGKGTTHRM